MSEIVPSVLADGIEPYSLYLELKEGQLLDIEVAAQIALALGAAIRDAAFIIDPSINIRIELLSGTEGSFSFNTFIKSINPKDLLTKKNLKTLACLCVAWFVTHSADYAFDKGADIVTALIESHLSGGTESVPLSEEDKSEIAQQVATLLKKDIASDKVQTIYRVINSDSAIKAVGASIRHAEKPSNLVPRHEFLARSGIHHVEEQRIQSRTKEKETTVTLISPVLLDGSPRKWRVEGPDGEFGASMKDESFLKSLTHGEVKIPMVANIQMDVILQIKETFKDGVWEVKERNIIKVNGVFQPPPAPQLDLDKPS